MSKYIDDLIEKHAPYETYLMSFPQAAAAIREAMEEQKRLDNEWHPWPEGGCETDNRMFVAVNDGLEQWVTIAYLSDFSGRWIEDNGDAIDEEVTHWRELPPGPEDV